LYHPLQTPGFCSKCGRASVAAPNSKDLRSGFVRAGVELLCGEGAERMRYDDGAQRVHAEGGALDRGFVLEDRRHDDG